MTSKSIFDNRNLFIESAEKEISPSTLNSLVDNLIEIFSEFQIKRLAVIAANSPGIAAVELAAFNAGIVLIPIPLFFTDEQRKHALQRSEADYILSDKDQSFYGDIYRLISTELFSYGLFKTGADPKIIDDISRITFTSGTTSDPKGVMLSRSTLEERTLALNKRIAGNSKDVFLSFMPYSILLETMTGIYLPLLNGAVSYVINGIESPVSDPQQVYKYLLKSQASVTVMMPHMINALSNYILTNELPVPDHLRFIGAGGAKINSVSLSLAAQACLPVYQGYGLSEAGSVVCLNCPEANKPGTVGKVLDGLSIRIQNREVQVKGKLFTAYTHIDGDFTDDGWLKTGDHGEIDDDGYLSILGRLKNTIITSNGRNISPEWLESELNSHTGVLQSFVIGEGLLNPIAFCAFTHETADKSEILKEVNSRLPEYARISRIITVNSHTLSSGKAVSPNGRIKRKEMEACLIKKFKIRECENVWV